MHSRVKKRANFLVQLNREKIHPGLEEVDLYLKKKFFPQLDDQVVWEMLDEELGDLGECGEVVESPREYKFFTFGAQRGPLELACRAVLARLLAGERKRGVVGCLRLFDGPETSTYEKVPLP